MDRSVEDGGIVAVVLIDETLGPADVIIDRLFCPPIGRVAVLIGLSACIASLVRKIPL